MTGFLYKLPEVLKAVTDPFSLLALMVIVLGFIAYPIVKRVPSTNTVLPPSILALSIITIAFVALGFNIVRVIPPKPTDEGGAKFNLQVVFLGKKTHTQPTTVPFRTSSGQLNVGCEESASTSVSWNLPEGAREANVSAAWENTDNIQGQSQQAAVVGTVATATGTIRGRNKEWLGNCPGGGHGQLVLKGTYVIDQGGREEQVTVKTYQDVVHSGRNVLVPIPVTANPFPSMCEVTVSGLDARSDLRFALTSQPDGKLQIADLQHTGTLDVKPGIQGTELIIALPNSPSRR